MNLYKFQPFSPTKELGKEYNAHCTLVPDPEDWILIMDYDAMILDFRAYSIMEKAIQANPETQIFGCYTNRVGYKWQRLNEEMSQNDSIRFHVERARQLADQYPNGESIHIPTAAGLFLLFQKKYWEKNNFKETILNPCFDVAFCDSALVEEKIKLIQGIYVWHSYRIMQEDHRICTHLKG